MKRKLVVAGAVVVLLAAWAYYEATEALVRAIGRSG